MEVIAMIIKLFVPALIGVLLIVLPIFSCNAETKQQERDKTIYDFSVKTIDGQEQSLSHYKGNVVLIVNVASKCGFTPQYKGLQGLYDKYKDKGFAVLGFPCNQFLSQEPGTNDEIKNFCSINFGSPSRCLTKSM